MWTGGSLALIANESGHDLWQDSRFLRLLCGVLHYNLTSLVAHIQVILEHRLLEAHIAHRGLTLHSVLAAIGRKILTLMQKLTDITFIAARVDAVARRVRDRQVLADTLYHQKITDSKLEH